MSGSLGTHHWEASSLRVAPMIRVKCRNCSNLLMVKSLEKAYQEFPIPCPVCHRHLVWPGGYTNKSKMPQFRSDAPEAQVRAVLEWEQRLAGSLE